MLRITLLFILVAQMTMAQTSEKSASQTHVPNQICLDNDVPFIKLPQGKKVAEFDFALYDRWGELVAETDDANFQLENILKVDASNLVSPGSYFAIIRIKLNDGSEEFFKETMTYFEYCNND